MKRRSTANTLLAIAAFLFAARFITAAIFGASMQGWNADNFRALVQYVGPDLTTAAVVVLVAGLLYLVWAELTER